jgi:hypothetical protein
LVAGGDGLAINADHAMVFRGLRFSELAPHPTLRNPYRLWSRACGGDVNIHNDIRNTIDGTGSELRIFPNRRVANASRQFDDPVMYFNTNGAGNDIRFSTELSEYVSLNLHIVFHQAVPS